MKIYLSGPITGLPDNNAPAFRKAERQWRDAGWEVCSPLDNGIPPDASWETHLRADIAILVKCDAIAMLVGWTFSKGARLEREIAQSLKMRIYNSDT